MAYFEKRFRVFAGPNGSGKSSIIHDMEKRFEDGSKIDLGTYINADKIGTEIRSGTFSITEYGLSSSHADFLEFSKSSGLLPSNSDISFFEQAFDWNNGNLRMLRAEDLLSQGYADRVAQLLALFLVDQYLRLGRKLTFETVFSHGSKVKILEEAQSLGYKVYLYFVSTSTPEINLMRVKFREQNGGHGVTPQKVRDRYWRSLENLGKACRYSYQAYFFDNSDEYRMIGHFKVVAGERKWDPMPISEIPEWFLVHCLEKFPESQSVILPA